MSQKEKSEKRDQQGERMYRMGFGELTGLPREKKKRVIKAEFGRNFTMCWVWLFPLWLPFCPEISFPPKKGTEKFKLHLEVYLQINCVIVWGGVLFVCLPQHNAQHSLQGPFFPGPLPCPGPRSGPFGPVGCWGGPLRERQASKIWFRDKVLEVSIRRKVELKSVHSIS